MCAITWLKEVILFGKSLLSRLVQEPSFYFIPGLRYEGKYKLHSIIGTIRYPVGELWSTVEQDPLVNSFLWQSCATSGLSLLSSIPIKFINRIVYRQTQKKIINLLAWLQKGPSQHKTTTNVSMVFVFSPIQFCSSNCDTLKETLNVEPKTDPLKTWHWGH